MSVFWNPWHGCEKYSEGCLNCYVYRIDAKHEKDSREVKKNADFDLPRRRLRDGSYKIKPGEVVFTCFSSDFLLEDADEWRRECFSMMKERQDLHFIFFTKRITRLRNLLPDDWGDGYDNVEIGCTCENQKRADERLPEFLSLPIKHRIIVCEPLLGAISLDKYLDGNRNKIGEVTAGGESGEGVRECDFSWVMGIRESCVSAGIPFSFHQTGAYFRKDGKLYKIPRRLQQIQAKKANIDYQITEEGNDADNC